MSHHLTPAELIDSLERPLAAAREAHAASCEACRAERARLLGVMREVNAVDVPEPSPLFWHHLTAHVRDRIADEPLPDARATLDWMPPLGWHWRWSAAVAVLVICAGLGWIGWQEIQRDRSADTHASTARRVTQGHAASPNSAATDGSRIAAASRSEDGDRSSSRDPGSGALRYRDAGGDTATPRLADRSVADGDDDEWLVVRRMAEEVTWDEAGSASMFVRPATVESALSDLTPDERRVLAQLVQAELTRRDHPSRDPQS